MPVTERAHKSIKRVTYLEYAFHTLANAPWLDAFGAELIEMEGGICGGVKKQ
jgi:hypothetical protein